MNRSKRFPVRTKVGRFDGFDFRELEKLRDKVKKANQSTLNEINKKAAESMAKVVCERLKENTPIGVKWKDGKFDDFGGYMRSNWRIEEVIQHRRLLGAKTPAFSIKIVNDVPYGKAVEEGHKQKVGRYVSQLRRKLVKPKIEGLNVIGNTIDDMSESGELQRILRASVKDLVEVTFSGK